MPMSEPLTSEENAQLLHLLKDNSDNIRHAKAQQWQVGYYTLLAYGGLVVTAYKAPSLTHSLSCIFGVLLCISTFGILILSIFAVKNLHEWISNLRKSMEGAEKHLSCKYRCLSKIGGARGVHEIIIYSGIVAGFLITLFIIVETRFANSVSPP